MSKIDRPITKYKLRDIAILVSIFIMLYVNSSYNVAIIKGTVTLGVSLISAIILIMVKSNIKINIKTLLVVLLLCINVVLTGMFMGDAIIDIIIMISVILICFIFVFSVSLEEYFNKYNKIMYLLAFFSLVVYILAVFFPNIIRMFPSAYYRPTQEVYNLGLSFINLRGSLIRNMGIFWEPGAFQTYLVIAFLGELFILKKKNNKRIWVLFLALITTWSTTGLINVVILMLIYLAHNNIHKRNRFFKTIYATVLFSLFLLIVYSFLPYEIQYAFIGKIRVFLESDKSEITSAYVRMTSFTYPLKEFLGSPIMGVGYNGLINSVLPAGHTMVTNTLINWFAAYGIVFGGVCLSGIYGLSSNMNDKSKLIVLLIVCVLLLSIISQQYLRNPSLFVFVLYGVNCMIEEKKENKL